MNKIKLSIAYPVSEGLPRDKARSIQVINTITALAENAVVYLLLGGEKRENEDALFEFYSIKKKENLHILYLPALRSKKGRLRPSWNGIYNIACFFIIMYIKKYLGLDVIYVRHLKLASFLLKVKSILMIPIVFESHEIFYISLDEDLKKKGLRKTKKVERLMKLEKEVYSSVDGMTAISNSLIKMLRKRFIIKTDIRLASDGANLSLVDSKQGFEDKIYYIGQLYEWKGVQIAIEAMRFVDRGILYIVGGSNIQIDNLKGFAESLSVIRRLSFIPRQPYSAMKRYWSDADIFLLPLTNDTISSHFTSPLKLFEYMNAGKAVIASDLPSTREVLTHMENAYLVKPEDPLELAKAINLLLSKADITSKLASKALEDVKKYSWQKRADTILLYLKETVLRFKGIENSIN